MIPHNNLDRFKSDFEDYFSYENESVFSDGVINALLGIYNRSSNETQSEIREYLNSCIDLTEDPFLIENVNTLLARIGSTQVNIVSNVELSLTEYTLTSHDNTSSSTTDMPNEILIGLTSNVFAE